MNDISILLPSKLKTVNETGTHGVYEIEGLYPGYGHTLGNSLRRVALSSIPGTAITAVKFSDVSHEFAAIKGIKEDVITMLLHLKKVRFKSAVTEPQILTIDIMGPCVVTAKDIATNGFAEVLNPELYIAEITEKKKLSLEITIQRGVGFVSRDVIHKEKVPAGTMAVDAIFSPLKRVSYEVENMRVGDRTDHNLLRINIDTDGSITPKEALVESLMVLRAQFKAILDLKDVEPEEEVVIEKPVKKAAPMPKEEDTGEIADVLKTRIEGINFSSRTSNALHEANIRTLGGLVKKSEKDILMIDGIGEKALTEIKDVLTGYDLKLAE